jgi:hypothetical protein
MASPAIAQTTSIAGDVADIGAPATLVGKPDSAKLQFRRVFVPADRPEQWPTGGQRYLPIDKSEFEQLLTDVHEHYAQGTSKLAVRIARAEHHARFQAEHLLVGRSTIDIVLSSDQPALLNLTPWSAAIIGARWNNESDQEGKNPEETIPIVLGNRPNGDLALLVEQSGQLIIDWQLRGQRGLTGSVNIPLQLPQTATTQWLLEIPTEYRLAADRVHVQLLADSNADDNLSQWQLLTGGREPGTLRLLKRDADAARRELNLLRQTDVVRVSPRGIDVLTRLRIDVHGEPLSFLLLEIDPQLEVVSTRQGSTQLNWTWLPSDETSRRGIRVELPAPLASGSHVIEIEAVAPPAIDRLQTLPQIICKNTLWQEGSMELNIDRALELRLLNIEQARQGRPPEAAADSAGTIIIQYFNQRAHVGLIAGYPQLQLAVGTTEIVQFTPSEITVRAVYDLSCQQGEQSLLVANVGSRWQIDSVESEDARLVGDWDVEGADPNRRLTVRLAAAVRPDHPVRVTVLGRRGYGLGDALAVSDLTVLHLPHSENFHRRMWLEEPDGLDWQITGKDDVTRLNLDQVPVDDLLRGSATKHGSWGFLVDDRAEAVRVATSPRRPRFSTAIRCEATVDRATTTERLRIQCRSSGTAMDRLLVHLSRPIADESFSWQGDKALGTVSARRLSADEQLSAGAGSVGQAWELTWRTPSREPFEISATIERAAQGETPITLVAAPEAVEQLGEVEVRVAENMWAKIDNRRLQPLPARSLAADEVPSSAGSFRYDPRRDGLMDSPAIMVEPQPLDTATRGAWAWQGLLDTRLSNRNEATHMAVFKIQTAGQSELELTLPGDAELLMLWMNDLRHLGNNRRSQKLTLELPPDRALATISVCYRTRQSLPQLATNMVPDFPKLSIPVLSHRWRVWVPQGYDILTESPQAHRYSLTPLTWSQRLLGPTGRPVNGPSRNPFSAEFRRLRRDWSAEHELSLANGRRVVAELGQLVQESDPACATWGGLLTRLSAAVPEVELRVAQAILIESGISPQSPVKAEARTTPLQAGNHVLRSAQLILLVRGRQVLVAPAALAAMARDEVRIADDAEVVAVTQGRLADDLSQAKQPYAIEKPLSDKSPKRAVTEGTASTPDFVAVDTWVRMVSSHSPWNLPDVVDASLSENSGWRCAEFYFPNDETIPQASIVNRQQLKLASLILAGTIAVLGITLRFASKSGWLALVAIAAALALLVPIQWSTLATCLFLSATASALWFVCCPPKGRLTSAHSPSQETADGSHSGLTTATVAGSIALALTLFVETVQAEITANEVQELPAVLMPIDAERKPVGTTLHLPEDFYRQLLAQSAQARAVPSEWLITQARYRVNLAADNIVAGGTHLELRAVWTLQVFSGTTEVHIPLFGEGIDVVRASVRLDGRPTAITINDRGLTVPVQTSSVQRLELTVRVPRQFLGSLNGLELYVPPVADARLELIHGDPSPLEAFETWGDIARDTTRDTTVASLGGVTRLLVRWRGIAKAEGIAPNFEVDELLWAKVRPGAMIVDLRLVVRVLSGKVRQLRIETDPNLQLVTAVATGATLAPLPVVNGESQQFELELAEPVTDNTTIDLRFVMSDTSGIGNLRFPRCRLMDVAAARRYWGVSIDPALEFREESEEQFRPLAVPDFVAAWGEANILPDLAYREFPGERTLSIATRPKSVQLVTKEKVVATARRNDAEIRWSAEIAKSSSSVYQWQVRVPTDLRIDRIALVDAHGNSPQITWMRDAASALVTVRSLVPISAEHRLTLWARIVAASGEVWSIPTISLVDATLVSREVIITRDANVQVHLDSADGWQATLDVAEQVTLPPNTRLVSAFAGGDATANPIRLRTEFNSPVVQGSLLTIVNNDGERWSADLEVQLQVDRGVLDAIELVADRSWQRVDWLDADSVNSAALQDNSQAETGDRTIRIRLHEPSSGAMQWTLRGDLEVDDRPKLPEIRLLQAHSTEQFVLLPRHRDVATLAWKTVGLERLVNAKPPEIPAALVESHELYRVVQPRPQAWPVVVEASNAQRRVELAEHWLACFGRGPIGGIASFYLAPTELAAVEIRLPDEMVPVHCRCENTPIELTRQESGLWLCPLPATNAPQAITLIYRQVATSTSNAPTTLTTLPRIEQAEVGQSLCWAAGASQHDSQTQETATLAIDSEAYRNLRSAAIKTWRENVAFAAGEPLSTTKATIEDADRNTGQSLLTEVGPIAQPATDKDQRMESAERFDVMEPIWLLEANDAVVQTKSNGAMTVISTVDRSGQGSAPWLRWMMVGIVCIAATMVLIHQGPRSQIGKVSAKVLLIAVAVFAVLWSAIPLAGVALGAVALGWYLWQAYHASTELNASR